MATDDHPAQDLWDRLLTAARDAARCAYAPYSGYKVGAAALTTSGEIVTGANVENASYGLTLCAECSLVAAAARAGDRITHLVCVHDQQETIAPCGRCRQLIVEHAAPGCSILLEHGVFTIDELLPASFGPSALERVR